MAVGLLLGSFAGCCLGAWVLAGPQGRDRSVRLARLRLVCRDLAEAACALGEGRVLGWLGGVEACEELAHHAAGTKVGRGLGLRTPAARAALVCALGVVGLVGLVVAGPVGMASCVSVAVMVSLARAASLKKARLERLAHQVPGVFRSLAGACAAGNTLSQAIAYVGGRGDGELGREFARAGLRVSCGASASEALEELAGRVEAPGIDLMVCALVVSARTGAPLQELFLRSARLAERRFELERELRAKTAQVRLSARIVGMLPVGMVALLSLLSPDFREGLSTPVGAGCVGVACVLDGVALVRIRALMRGVV